jgi:hypothetical protein
MMLDKTNKNLVHEIENIVKEQIKVKHEMEEAERKIHFLNNGFIDVVIPVFGTKFVGLIADEIKGNEQAIIDMFFFRGIKELKVKKHVIGIRNGFGV